ncbi:hypothetical protein TWF506_003686 [Arthrobotrys conoides]|uniref:Uncharacterized protein n=1 Tax=Arthrobotrys conoides TaxID=74498 RepID=A0AAN8RQL3_9PEZI
MQQLVSELPEVAIEYGGPVIFSKQKEGRKKIVNHHKSVLQVSRRLVESKLSKRGRVKPYWAKEEETIKEADELLYNSLTVSDAEEGRIIQAIYRFFVGINTTYVFFDESDYETGFKYGLESWGPRGIAAVRVVRDFFLEQLSKIEDSSSYRRNWELGMDLDYGRPINPILPSRMILYSEFPDRIIHWIDGQYIQDPGHFHNELEEIQNFVSESLGYRVRPERWGAESLFFADADVRRSDGGNSILPPFVTSENETDFMYDQQWPWVHSDPRNKKGLPHHRSFARISGLRDFYEDVYVSRYERSRNALKYPHGHTPPFDPKASIWDLNTVAELGYCFCRWRLSRSERYQLLYDEENSENTWQALGAGCLMICEPYESDIHTDEHLLYTEYDDWDTFGRISRYKAKSRWKSREIRRGEGSIGLVGHNNKSRSSRQCKRRFILEAEIDETE